MKKFELAIGIGLSAMLFSTHAAAYDFDNYCAPRTEHDPSLLAPNVGFMLDRSGSMGEPSSDPMYTRWEAAEISINETVLDFTIDGACGSAGDPECDAAHFGFGYFSSSADWTVPTREDAHLSPNSVADAITALGAPSGGTRVGLAAQELAGEPSLDDGSRTNFGIFITDGAPTNGCNDTPAARAEMVTAIQALCSAKNRANPLFTYAVGFGPGATAGTNSMLSQAGGTGTCCDATDCLNVPIDLCAATVAELESYLMDSSYVFNGSTCTTVAIDPALLECQGSIQAATNDDLKNALGDIIEAATCSFPLEIPAGYPGGAALPDPDATQVELKHSLADPLLVGNIGDCTMPMGTETRDNLILQGVDMMTADGYLDEGWCFDGPSRNVIRLTQGLCDDIKVGDVDKVFTQVACNCPNVGNPCTVTGLMCPDPNGGPPINCTNEQLAAMPCSTGTIVCMTGTETCMSNGVGALPEICNGIDENCDGKIDNVAETEGDWPDPSVANGTHCNFENTCMCPQGYSDPVTLDGQIATLVASYTGTCVCGDSLDYSEDNSPTQENRSSQASCSSAWKQSKTPLAIWALLLGFVFTIRRRRS